MYPVGELFNQAAKGFSRQVVIRATFNDSVVVTGDYLQSITVKNIINAGDALTIGNTCSNQLDLAMYMPDTLTPNDIREAKIFLEIGFLNVTSALNAIDTQLYVNEILGYLYEETGQDGFQFLVQDGELIAESQPIGIAVTREGNQVVVSDTAANVANATFWLPFGVFYVDKADSKDEYRSVSITAFDGMALIEHIDSNYSQSDLRNEPTAPEAIQAIATTIGVETDIPAGLPNYSENIVRTAYAKSSYREMLGFFAGFMGCNACFDRSGKLCVKPYQTADYKIDRVQQYLNGFTKNTDEEITISSVSCKTSETSEDLRIIPNFKFGWYNATSNEFVPDFIPNSGGAAAFHTGNLPVIPGQTYTLTRSRREASDLFRILVYGRTDKRRRPEWVNDEFLTYDHLMTNNELSWQFTVNQPTCRYLFIEVRNVEYRDVTPPSTMIHYYEMVSSYTLIRNVPESGIVIGGGNGIDFVNPFIFNTTLLQPIFDLYNGMHYLPLTIKYRGNPALDAGDIIQVENRNSQCVNAIITAQTFKISGGMSATITSSGNVNSEVAAGTTNRYGAAASPTNANQRMQMQIDDLIERVTRLEGSQ